jgi:insertion element IS1 protein InsB
MAYDMMVLFYIQLMRRKYCHCDSVGKNGYNSVCTAKFLCKTCGRQCVENPKQRRISDKIKSLVDKLLLERISLAGIARVFEVSERWPQNYLNEKYRSVPLDGKVIAKSSPRHTIQCDGMWPFVGKCDDKQWIWLALDRYTREIVGVHMGEISADSAQSLWDSLPTIYQQHAISYTDYWEAYQAVFPKNRHHAVGKESAKTNYIERFDCTLRQRVSRWVRKTLPFSKKIENHVGAIYYFIHHYNDSIRARLEFE